MLLGGISEAAIYAMTWSRDIRANRIWYYVRQDYTTLTHYIHVTAPVVKTYAKKSQNGRHIQYIFRLTNGYYLRLKLVDLSDFNEYDVYYCIIWANDVREAFAIVTTKVKDGYKRVGSIDSLSDLRGKCFSPDGDEVCSSNDLKDHFGWRWWRLLDMKRMTLRIM